MADWNYMLSSVCNSDRTPFDGLPTLSCRHHMFEDVVSEHLRAGTHHYMSRNGTGALMYVSWCAERDVHGACSVSNRQDIDISPSPRLYLAPTAVKRKEPLTPFSLFC
jgi:hypothetical protein